MLSSSVVMATYNGRKYVADQIESILENLNENDELIISDDGSNDGTDFILEKYALEDARIKVLNGPKKGVIKNFEYGLYNANNDIIYLSDQDDIWAPDKIKTINSIFDNNSEITCVLHDVKVVDENLQILLPSFFKFRGSKVGLVSNLIKNSYMGSAMAFRRRMLSAILPIPERIPMHDQWIGLVNEAKGKSIMLDMPLGLYRRHSNNVSELEHGRIVEMIPKRVRLTTSLLSRLI